MLAAAAIELVAELGTMPLLLLELLLTVELEDETDTEEVEDEIKVDDEDVDMLEVLDVVEIGVEEVPELSSIEEVVVDELPIVSDEEEAVGEVAVAEDSRLVKVVDTVGLEELVEVIWLDEVASEDATLTVSIELVEVIEDDEDETAGGLML